jgi:hypothetical protein
MKIKQKGTDTPEEVKYKESILNYYLLNDSIPTLGAQIGEEEMNKLSAVGEYENALAQLICEKEIEGRKWNPTPKHKEKDSEIMEEEIPYEKLTNYIG